MGMATGGGAKPDTPSYKVKGEKLERSLVIEEVKIIEVPRRIEVPVYVEKKVEQIRWVTKDEPQIKYITKEVDTTRYTVKEETTTKFKVKEEETIRFIPKEVQVERPIAVPVEYERPVIKEKIIEVVSVSDVEAIRSLVVLVPQLLKDIEIMRKKLDECIRFKLVEKVIEVPKLEWISTPVERIIWKDVERIK